MHFGASKFMKYIMLYWVPEKKYNIQFFNGVTGGVDDEVEDVD